MHEMTDCPNCGSTNLEVPTITLGECAEATCSDCSHSWNVTRIKLPQVFGNSGESILVDIEEGSSYFMHALAGSDANVANITTEPTEDGVRVAFDLLDKDYLSIVRDIADQCGFDEKSSEQFELL
jgi:tRNA G46 methylase TrmB